MGLRLECAEQFALHCMCRLADLTTLSASHVFLGNSWDSDECVFYMLSILKWELETKVRDRSRHLLLVTFHSSTSKEYLLNPLDDASVTDQ